MTMLIKSDTSVTVQITLENKTKAFQIIIQQEDIVFTWTRLVVQKLGRTEVQI